MFDVAPTELLLVAVVALVVIGPKDLPKAMRVVGHWVGRARGMARHFRSGIDEMIRQSELEEMEKKWREENERIMREFPTLDDPLGLTDQSKPAEPVAGAAALPAPEPLEDAPPAAALPPPDQPAEPAESPADLANWHAAAEPVAAEPGSEPIATQPASEPPAVQPASAPPAPAAPAPEEQLSLLPPDPPAGDVAPGKPPLP